MDIQTGADDLTQQEQTDVESLASTGNSSVTQFQQSSSETELEFGDIDATINELVDSQFAFRQEKPTTSKEGVSKWLTVNVDEETQDLELQILDAQIAKYFDNTFDESDAEKTAAVLCDALKSSLQTKIPFNVSAWEDAEAEEQLVPSGDLKSNFMKEARERPVLTLMNFIKIYCNDTENKNDNIYHKIIKAATQSVQQTLDLNNESVKERQPVDMDTLKNFPGYFADLRLRIFQCPKNKLPFVRAVEKFVSAEIAEAAKANNAVIFTRYTRIQQIIEKCNNDKGLSFGPCQLVKYGLHLQKAVNQVIVLRCLDFLNHIGYPLTNEDDEREVDRLNLSSNEGFLSQGSQQDEVESCHSQNSHRSEMSDDGQQSQANVDPALAEAIFAAQNSPGFIEFMRGYNGQGDGNSPGGSQRSMYSNESYSQSPPQYSLPEREPEGAQPIINQVADEMNLFDYVVINPEDLLLLDNASEGSQNRLEDGEPLARRRRVE